MAETTFTFRDAWFQTMKTFLRRDIVCNLFVAFQAHGVGFFRLAVGMTRGTLLFQFCVGQA